MLIENQGGFRFVGTVGRHTVVSDQPRESGGQDSGPTPTDLFLAAVGMCAGVYAVEYGRQHGIKTEGMRIHVESGKAKAPYRIGRIQVSLEPPAPLPEEHRRPMLQFAKQCLLHNTLLHPPDVEVELL